MRDLKIKEVAELFGISKVTVLRYIHSGQLKGYRVGNLWRIPESEILAFIEKCNEQGKGVDII